MPTDPIQPDLFDDAEGPPPGPANAALVRVPGPAALLSKDQRAFNRASERLTALRAHVAAWEAADPLVRQRAATDLLPLQKRLATLQRETVLWIDAYLQRPPPGEKLPRKQRDKLVAMLQILAAAVLADGPDEAVEAAHDRHSDQSHRAQQQAQADLAAAVLGQALGDEALFDGEAESVDALLQRAGERLRERAEAPPPPPPPPGGRPSRAEQASARDARALAAASQSVREVYRRLASSLHPDREPDDAERARKTTLMARVNEAYGRNDLLALLQVQMDIEQIDAQHLAGVSDERLRHYTRVLKEQQQVLLDELAQLQQPVAEHLGQHPGGLAWAPRMLGDVLNEDIARTRAVLQNLQQDSQALRDARTRPALLKAMQLPEPDDDIDPFEAMLLMQALGEAVGPGPGQGPGPSRRGRRRR